MVAAAEDTTIVQQAEEFATMLIMLLSWAWVVIAFLAGKLLTNSFVYGTFIWLDASLWELWQVMRNFANFALWFLFVYYILANFVWRLDVTELKQKVLGMLGAAILIQASWFLMAVLIDLSTIWIAAVSSVPFQVMGDKWVNHEQVFTVPEKIYVDDFLQSDLDRQEFTLENRTGRTLQNFLPQADTVAWPLLFLWASVMQALDMQIHGHDNIRALGGAVIVLLLKAIALVMFVVPLLGLLVVAMMRIFYIWIWILTIPFIILDQLVLWQKLAGNPWLQKIFSVKDALWLIFQPILIVGVMSIAVIFLIGMWSMLIWDSDANPDADKAQFEQLMQYSVIDDKTAKIGNEMMWETFIKWDFLVATQQYVWWPIGQIILFVFTILMLWMLFQLTVKWSSITASVLGNINKAAKTMFRATPIPWMWWAGIGALDIARKQAWAAAEDTVYKDRALRERGNINKLFDRVARGSSDVGDFNPEDKRQRQIQIGQAGENQKKVQTFARLVHTSLKDDGLSVQYGISTEFTDLLNTQLRDPEFVQGLEQLGALRGIGMSIDEVNKNPEQALKNPHLATYIYNMLRSWEAKLQEWELNQVRDFSRKDISVPQ